MTEPIPRNIEPVMCETIASRRVTAVTGPRQSGKTTLVTKLAAKLGGTLRQLDDEALLRAAIDDPVGFVTAGRRPLVIDEIQRAGDPLVRAIKAEVDRNQDPGQFVLTGSSNFLTVPGLTESLAGRAAFMQLGPFTQGEVAGVVERFIDTAFQEPQRLRRLPTGKEGLGDYLARICAGGYPEVQRLPPRQRTRWYADYLHSITQRDIVELGGIRKAGELPKLLRLLAARTASELVMQHIIDDAAVARQAVYDYVALLRTVYLVHEIPSWSRNLTARVKRHPKVYISDSGLAAHLLGKGPGALGRPDEPATGPLMETFVVNELQRQTSWAETAVTLFHFRDRQGAEVDVVLEAADGRVVALEVKAGLSFRPKSLDWLAKLRDLLDGDFVHGILLYAGRDALPLGDRLTALPISALWRVTEAG
ncbi:MAG: ATP-binding protein [Egibacteraceae bacterium]